MKKILRLYNEVLAYIGVLGLIGFCGAVLVQIISRTFLPTSPNWTEEASRFLFIFMVAFAGNTAVSKDGYVGVDMLVSKFSPKAQKIISVIVLAAIFVFSATLCFGSVLGPKGLLAMTPPAMKSTAMQLPMKYVYYSMVILFLLYCLSFPMRIYCIIKDIDLYEDEKEGEA